MTLEAPSDLPRGGGSNQAGPWIDIAIPALAIVALTFAAYFPALHAGFVWDDDHHFADNPLMTAPGGLLRIWTEHRFYYPLASSAWWAMRRIFALDPFPYHFLNIVLQALNAILFWRLLKRLTIPGAWVVAAVFALHPVNVQSVAWATELKNCLSGAFYLAALLAWTCFRDGEPKKKFYYYGLTMFVFLLALAAKTSTVVLPLTLIFVDLWKRRSLNAKTATGWIPFLILSGLAGFLTLSGHESMVEGPDWNLSLAQRLVLAGRCVWFYLGKLALPVNLTFVYPRWSINPADPFAWIPLAALIALFGILFWFRRRPAAFAALLAISAFVAALLPILNLFRMYYARYAFAADHWQYLACMPAIAWAVGSAAHLIRKLTANGPKFHARLLAGALLLLLAQLTWHQTKIYQNSETLWTDVISENPGAAIAYNNLGVWQYDRGDLSSAEATLRAGLERNPGDIELQTILAAVLLRENRFDETRLLMEKADAASPNDPEILNNLGLAERGLGRRDAALGHFAKAVAIDPGYAEIQMNYVQTLVQAGRRDAALSALESARRADPENPAWAKLKSEILTQVPSR